MISWSYVVAWRERRGSSIVSFGCCSTRGILAAEPVHRPNPRSGEAVARYVNRTDLTEPANRPDKGAAATLPPPGSVENNARSGTRTHPAGTEPDGRTSVPSRRYYGQGRAHGRFRERSRCGRRWVGSAARTGRS